MTHTSAGPEGGEQRRTRCAARSTELRAVACAVRHDEINFSLSLDASSDDPECADGILRAAR